LVIKILVADNHEIFRKGVKELLKETNDKFVIDEASNGNEVIAKMWKNDYDAVLLDISMPGRNGIDILKQLKGYKPDLQVLILSTYPEEQFAMRALKAGAAGFLTKAVKPDELVTAIQHLLKGKRYISSSLADTLVNYVEYGDHKAPHEVLSDREYEIMCMTAEGKTVKQIASELSLSDKTVSTYRARTLIKLNMNNTAQLIQYVINNNLINQNYE
jgi:DNA-binding NarL/FixJ family response regulator